MERQKKNWIAVACADISERDMRLIAGAMAADPALLYF
jgi:hypothetical protein